MGTRGLDDNKPHHARTWNQLLPRQVDKFLEYASFCPELSCHEITLYITDNDGFSISESTVYRRLKERGLIRKPKIKTFPASDEFRIKTTEINQLWQMSAVLLFIVLIYCNVTSAVLIVLHLSWLTNTCPWIFT
jgi:hypothetical protein